MYYTILDTEIGKLILAKTARGLSFASLARSKRREQEIIEFIREKGEALEFNDKKFIREKKLFKEYFSGKPQDFTSLPLDFITGTPFLKKVWLEARKIPYGKTASYKSLARKLRTRGYRSIGQAMARNPLLILVPCHRVLGSDGSLGGFSIGLKIKEFLLRLENPSFPIRAAD